MKNMFKNQGIPLGYTIGIICLDEQVNEKNYNILNLFDLKDDKLFFSKVDESNCFNMNEIGIISNMCYYMPYMEIRDIGHLCESGFDIWDGKKFNELLTKHGIDEKKKVGKLSDYEQKMLMYIVSQSHGARIYVYNDINQQRSERKRFIDFLLDKSEETNIIVYFTENVQNLPSKVDYIGIIYNSSLIILESQVDICEKYSVTYLEKNHIDMVDDIIICKSERNDTYKVIVEKKDIVRIKKDIEMRYAKLEDFIECIREEKYNRYERNC